jgi:Protein of unknown function (DUF3467)
MRPVELLQQDHPGKLMRKGHRAEGEAVIDARKRRRPERPAHHESEVGALHPALLDEAAERQALVCLALHGQQTDERAVGHTPRNRLRIALGRKLKACVTGEQRLVVLDVVEVGRPQPSLPDHDQTHLAAPTLTGCDTSLVNEQDPGAERHINIHLSPEVMGGVYANFANVSHSDYEFTVTFARVDHEVEADEVPGVVVSRVNLSPRFMRELISAMEDNYSKWRTREGIKNLPEYGGQETGEADSEQ